VKQYKNYNLVLEYVENVLSGKKVACKETKEACQRFKRDLKNSAYDFKPKDAEFVIGIIEKTFVHQKGEDMQGYPLRGRPFLLEPWQKFVVYNLLGFFHKGTILRKYKEAFIMLPRKQGKALSLDTPLPTPNGWTTMGDVQENDMVFGRDGKPTRVKYKSEIFTDHDCYEFIFEDGEKIIADKNHIWKVMTKDSRRTNKKKITNPNKSHRKYEIDEDGYMLLVAEDMINDFVRERKDGKGKEYKYRVPMNEPVAYEEKELPVHPYMLGVWLGDGDSDNTRITTADEDKEEMMKYIRDAGYVPSIITRKNRIDAIGIDMSLGYNGNGRLNRLREQLREIGVFENKHIPQIYLQASIQQRLELLKGLMDTDGYVSVNGQCEFSQSDKGIIDSFVELLGSLGIKCSVSERLTICNNKKHKSYRVTFYTDKSRSCFKLERKEKRLKEKLSSRMKNKTITSIKKIDTVNTQCISVDNDEGLYLAGNRFTVTHNTPFMSALAWGLGLLERRSGAEIVIVGALLKQALQSFNFLLYNLKEMGEEKNFRILDNNQEHSISGDLGDGYMRIETIAGNSDRMDSLNTLIQILDELHLYKNASQYNTIKESGKAYRNSLCIGITTAGDNMNSFCYNRMKYCQKILDGSVKDEQYYVFIAKADEDENGDVDYTNPIEHEKANPNYNVSVSAQELMNDAMQAQNDPQQRKSFLAKSLNIYTSAMKAYFNIDEFRASDRKYNWTLEQLARLPIEWYGGADLSRRHDLTASALYGTHGDVDIAITHAFFPIVAAHEKADEDNIPLFGWQDDGWLTMCNNPIVDYEDVIKWFLKMKRMGFNIKQTGFDRKFGREFFLGMRRAGFRIEDTPQLYYLKSEGFRRIETKAKEGKFYYLHSDAYEYCLQNVRAIEQTDDAVKYEKVEPTQRIDLFDASVFAAMQMLKNLQKSGTASKWLKGGE
jgi:phage terminase large subunit-like protein